MASLNKGASRTRLFVHPSAFEKEKIDAHAYSGDIGKKRINDRLLKIPREYTRKPWRENDKTSKNAVASAVALVMRDHSQSGKS